MTEFVPRPLKGRLYSTARRVRLSDAGPDARLRLDGLARYLQDVASDDWADSGLSPEGTWVVRRTCVQVAPRGRWPRLGEEVTLKTWCGGTGPAWAERRSDVEIEGALMVQAAALWVPLDSSGRPLRLEREFLALYGEAAAGRRVTGRVPAPVSPGAATTQPWPIRRADLDVVGHVNNAAVWTALSEVAPGPVESASMTHHGAVEEGQVVTLASAPGRIWLTVNAEVKVSGEFFPA